MTPYQITKARSYNRCEAMVQVNVAWTRCFRAPVEVHHMLTRARGGLLLDDAGETAHLIALCPAHHRYAHGPDGYESGLMMDGYISTTPDGELLYSGTDERLSHLRQP